MTTQEQTNNKVVKICKKDKRNSLSFLLKSRRIEEQRKKNRKGQLVAEDRKWLLRRIVGGIVGVRIN